MVHLEEKEKEPNTPELASKWLDFIKTLTALLIAITALAAAATGAVTPIVERMFGQDTDMQTRMRTIEGVIEEQSKMNSRILQSIDALTTQTQNNTASSRDTDKELERTKTFLNELRNDIRRHEIDIIRLGVRAEGREQR